VKYNAFVCAVAVLLYSPADTFARPSLRLEEQHSTEFDSLPLLEWEENDLWAQQTPPVATTPPVVTPPASTTPSITPPAQTPAAPPAPASPPAVATPETEEPADPAAIPEENMSEDDFSLGDIPIVETLELTLEKARSALDVYVLVREKYKDAALEDYENLQDFVDQSPQGKAFESDVKAVGFADVTEWNTTITTLSFAYDNLRDDQTKVIEEQISELQADTEIAQDMKDRMIQALKSMIPSPNNKAIVDTLNADPVYKEKLKLLETEGE
jgi:hypothetical protein